MKEIIKIWEEFSHDFYKMAECILELREEIESIEGEIDEHVCEHDG